METTEIIAELRRLLTVGDSPVFCGGTFISKQLAKDAADRLEYLDSLVNEWEAVVHGQTTGDLISRSAVLAELSKKLSIVDMIGVAEIVESIPAVCEGVYSDWYERLSDLDYNYHPEPNGEPWYQAKDVWACIEEEQKDV